MARAKTGDVVWIAEMRSERFKWIAIGGTEEEAMQALKKRWNENSRAANRVGPMEAILTWDHFTKSEGDTPFAWYGGWLRVMQVGKAYLEDESEERNH